MLRRKLHYKYLNFLKLPNTNKYFQKDENRFNQLK